MSDLNRIILMVVVFGASFGIGYALISKVPQRLHTPLMSMTNAISAVTILGALLLFAGEATGLELALGAVALLTAGFNLVGGFAVTARMLKMFKR
ncbi:MAG: NAD(P) transhydrogenase subunit alpha [Candidatus Omnitrophota bacterium]